MFFQTQNHLYEKQLELELSECGEYHTMKSLSSVRVYKWLPESLYLTKGFKAKKIFS